MAFPWEVPDRRRQIVPQMPFPGMPQISDPRDAPTYQGPTSPDNPYMPVGSAVPIPNGGAPRAPGFGQPGTGPGSAAGPYPGAAPMYPTQNAAGAFGGAAGTPGATGTGNLGLESILENPRVSAIAALRQKGINPYSGNPIANAFLKQAASLGNIALGGVAGTTDVVGALKNSFSQLLDKALSGQAVFPTGGVGADFGATVKGAQDRVNAGTATLGDQVLAQAMADPEQAARLIANLQYGGQGERFAGIGARNLSDMAAAYNQEVLAGGLPGGAQAAGTPGAGGFLEALLAGILPQVVARQNTNQGLPPPRY